MEFLKKTEIGDTVQLRKNSSKVGTIIAETFFDGEEAFWVELKNGNQICAAKIYWRLLEDETFAEG